VGEANKDRHRREERERVTWCGFLKVENKDRGGKSIPGGSLGGWGEMCSVGLLKRGVVGRRDGRGMEWG
jgi:hypothetical protein